MTAALSRARIANARQLPMDVAILVVITSADVISGLITTAFHVAQRSQGAAGLYEEEAHLSSLPLTVMTTVTTTQMPRTPPEILRGAIFSAEMTMMSVLHGLSNITSTHYATLAFIYFALSV